MNLKTLIKSQLGISLHLVEPTKRGFIIEDLYMSQHIKGIGISFLTGYHAALKTHEIPIADQLNIVTNEYKGFAYEGAAMTLTLIDFLTFSRTRFKKFVENEGRNHIYMAYVGAGWALARCPHINYRKFLNQLNPSLKWLVIDGHGFHDGYFNPKKVILKKVVPNRYIGSYAENAYMQGVGRSIWFYTGGNVEKIQQIIKSFPEIYKSDLWGGVGLASAYAGGVGIDSYKLLKHVSGDYFPELAQGVTFAAKARHLANTNADHTHTAVSVICGMSLEEAVGITDKVLRSIHAQGGSYEMWRRDIREIFKQRKVKYEYNK